MNININKFSFGKLYQPMNILKNKITIREPILKKEPLTSTVKSPFKLLQTKNYFNTSANFSCKPSPCRPRAIITPSPSINTV